MPVQGRVQGKVVLITGGASGMGRASALLLAREGGKIIISDIDEGEGRKAVGQLKRAGGKAIFIKHDVTKENSWRQVINKVLKEFGRLDVLVNNAGVIFSERIEHTSLRKWRWLMSINLDGVFLGTKYAIKAMKGTGGGSIINMSSAAGIVGTGDTTAYGASKGAVRLFTKATAIECSKAGHGYNIRVNSIHPGVIETPMLREKLKDAEWRESRIAWHPIGRIGQPEDVAYGVLYLASDESKFITGAELVIDGGWTAR